MPPIDQDLRGWIELIYFLSGPTLALFAIAGFIQIWLFKEDMRIKAIRASREKALECGGEYAEFVILNRQFIRECHDRGLTMYAGEVGDFEPGSLTEEQTNTVKEKIRLDSYVMAMNKLEFIAAHFVTGIADDDTGFRLFGRAFCSVIKCNYDLFVIRDGEASNSHVQYTRELYEAWSERLSARELIDLKLMVETQLNSCARKNFIPIGIQEK